MKFISLLAILAATTLSSITNLHAAAKHSSHQFTPSEGQKDNHSSSSERQLILTCPVCLDRQVNTLFNPCHHMTSCQVCALKLDHCPQCRSPIQSRTEPVVMSFFHTPEDLSEDPQPKDFELLCSVCKNHPVDTLYTPCNHLSTCHECALKTEKCPQCLKSVSNLIYPVYISFIPDIGAGDEEDQDRGFTDSLDSESELRSKLQKFIQDVRHSSDFLAEIEKVSQSHRPFNRSGQELVLRAQASAFISLGLELSAGCYSTSHFKGVPYIRLGFVSGFGLGSTIALSAREYSRDSRHPAPDYTANLPSNFQETVAFGLGSTGQNASLDNQEKGVAFGFFASCADRGKTIVRIPLFLPTQYLSKKGRLLLKAKKLEMRMLKLIKMRSWEKLYQDVLPEYQNTVGTLAEEVRRRNSIYRSYRALPSDHPFHSLDNLINAIR